MSEPKRRLVLATLMGDWGYVLDAAQSQGLTNLAAMVAENAELSVAGG